MKKCKAGGCPQDKEICCMACDEPCKEMCNALSDDCMHLVYEGMAPLEVFESKAEVAIRTIASIAGQKKALDEQDQQMRKQLEKVMNECNVKSFENDLIKITYIEPTTRETVDTKRLKEEQPEIAEKYTKVSKVKGSTRITVK